MKKQVVAELGPGVNLFHCIEGEENYYEFYVGTDRYARRFLSDVRRDMIIGTAQLTYNEVTGKST